MEYFFLIPARGGSRGLPGKNVALVGGIPMVGRAVRTARRALAALGGAGRVVCSTDDERIAAAAVEWGAEVPFVRPAPLASDEARSIDVVLHAVDALALSDDVCVVLMQPTSPSTAAEDILAVVREHRRSGSPAVSVVAVEHPLSWTMRSLPDGSLAPVVDGRQPARRQDGAALARLNGAVYVASAGWLRREKAFVGPSTRGIAMPAERSVDIDSQADLDLARALLATRPVAPVAIAGRAIGPGHPCFVIAEAGVNHNGSLDLALQLVDAAAAAGADAVKFQTFKAEEVVSQEAPQAEYQRMNTGRVESQLEMVRRLQLGPDEHRAIAERCRALGIMFLSSPFDEPSVALLADLGVPAFKIGSGELTNHLLLGSIARRGLPLIVSTGMATLSEVAGAETVILRHGAPPFALLHCVSNYPVAPKDCNLAAMDTLREAFGVPVGWSDHTLGVHIAVAAVAAGACIVEKHLTLDRGLPGPDHRASLQPGELAEMARCIRDVEAARGTGEKRRAGTEEDTARVARRSLFTTRSLEPGHLLVAEDVKALRPGTGIPPGRLGELVGRRLRRAVPAGAMLAEGDLE
ncbi:MAG TPA: N-acetylneuraminate synthase [Thermoanaerobaculaceae bacterium]|nr:N-acetylneuraminate synthase [Thermoanaerobaculaceae bacterium]